MIQEKQVSIVKVKVKSPTGESSTIEGLLPDMTLNDSEADSCDYKIMLDEHKKMMSEDNAKPSLHMSK